MRYAARAGRAAARGRGDPASRAIAAPTAGSARATRSGSCRRSAASPAPPSGSPRSPMPATPATVDGVYAFGHPHGCSQLGEDLDGTRVAARRPGLPSQCRRRAADRPRLRIEPARPADARRYPKACAAASAPSRAQGVEDEIEAGLAAGRRARRDRRALPGASRRRSPSWSSASNAAARTAFRASPPIPWSAASPTG